MEHYPYEPFVNWAQQYCTDSFYRNERISKSAQAWIISFGVTAGRIHRYLEFGHPGSQALPNSLIMDIVELEQSPYAGFPDEDPHRALIDTWSGLAQVYGTARTPGDRELHRLMMLTEWAETLDTPPGVNFPSRRLMLARFHEECRRLDLAKLRKEDHNFKHVGILVELLKLYRPLLPTGDAASPVLWDPEAKATKARRPRRPRTLTMTGVRVPQHRDTLPGSKPKVEPVKERQLITGHALYGNWADNWRNTLPNRN